MKVAIGRWEDGNCVQKELCNLDRWEVHAAHRLRVQAAGCTVDIEQQPHALGASRAGVGACAWDSTFMLLAYFEQQDLQRWQGCRVVELGAGVGLLGIFLAKLGAQVVLTDQAPVMSLLTRNVDANFDRAPASSQAPAEPRVLKLDWDEPEDMRMVQAGMSGNVDLVLAADCCYVDEGGRSAHAETIIRICAGLCVSPHTCCLMTFERRSEALLAELLAAAHRSFRKVQEIDFRKSLGDDPAWAPEHLVLLCLEGAEPDAGGQLPGA